MKTFKILASYTAFVSLTVDAESREDAERIAREADGSDFRHDEFSDWKIDEILEN